MLASAPPRRSPESACLVALAGRLVALDLSNHSVETLAEMPHGADIRLQRRCLRLGGAAAGSAAWRSTSAPEPVRSTATPAASSSAILGMSRSRTASAGRPTAGGCTTSTRPPGGSTCSTTTSTPGRRRTAGPFVAVEARDAFPTGSPSTTTAASGSALWGGVRGPPLHARRDARRGGRRAGREVTACCFGGSDGRSLYVTTASIGLTAERRGASPTRAASSSPTSGRRAAGVPVRAVTH